MGRFDSSLEQPQDLKMMKGFLQATKYLNTHLNADEYPLYRAHLSWIPVFFRQVPFILIGGIAGGITWGVVGDFFIGAAVFLAAWVIGLISQFHQIYKNIATDILLTNQGIHSKYKLFAVEDDQFSRYDYVNDATLSYDSIMQRLFEYGQIKIDTVGTDANFEFSCLAKPKTLKAAVRAAQSKYGRMGAYGGTGIGTPDPRGGGRGKQQTGKKRPQPGQSQSGRGALGAMTGSGIPSAGRIPAGEEMILEETVITRPPTRTQGQGRGRNRKPGGNRRRGKR